MTFNIFLLVFFAVTSVVLGDPPPEIVVQKAEHCLNLLKAEGIELTANDIGDYRQKCTDELEKNIDVPLPRPASIAKFFNCLCDHCNFMNLRAKEWVTCSPLFTGMPEEVRKITSSCMDVVNPASDIACLDVYLCYVKQVIGINKERMM